MSVPGGLVMFEGFAPPMDGIPRTAHAGLTAQFDYIVPHYVMFVKEIVPSTVETRDGLLINYSTKKLKSQEIACVLYICTIGVSLLYNKLLQYSIGVRSPKVLCGL